MFGIRKIYPKAQLNGFSALPHIANVWIPGISAQDLLIRLDLAGVAVSAGSACTARSSQPSHVLKAMGFNEKRTKESIRISLGRPTTSAEVKRLLKLLTFP
jgi:cysteine desulfurase